jgi:hypothetical protein
VNGTRPRRHDPALSDQLLAWLALTNADDPTAALAAELATSSSVKHESCREIRRALGDRQTL